MRTFLIPFCKHEFKTLPDLLTDRVRNEGIQNFVKSSGAETVQYLLPILLEREDFESLHYLQQQYPELFINFQQHA